MIEQLYRYKGWDGFVKVDEQKQRLADAAPQLLEACALASGVIHDFIGPEPEYVAGKLRAAIAAAKGEK